MRVGTWLAVPLALGMTLGCQPTAETAEQAQARMDTESAAAKTAIEAQVAEFVSHFNQGHADVAGGFYAEQGRVMPPNEPAQLGRAAIIAGMTPFMAMKPTLTLTTESVVANGPIAIERGMYSVTFTPPGSPAPVSDTGKYLVHWHLIDGKWLMVDDIWNSDQPPMPMGPPAKP